jgi:circadian clock protein KaiB
MNKDRRKMTASSKDAREQLEKAAGKRDVQKYILRLYVSGMTPRSIRAIENIRKLCEEKLKGRYELEVIDIFKHPDKARTGQVVAAPTLVKELPLPLRRFIGDLSDSEKILVGMEIKEKPSPD